MSLTSCSKICTYLLSEGFWTALRHISALHRGAPNHAFQILLLPLNIQRNVQGEHHPMRDAKIPWTLVEIIKNRASHVICTFSYLFKLPLWPDIICEKKQKTSALSGFLTFKKSLSPSKNKLSETKGVTDAMAQSYGAHPRKFQSSCSRYPQKNNFIRGASLHVIGSMFTLSGFI